MGGLGLISEKPFTVGNELLILRVIYGIHGFKWLGIRKSAKTAIQTAEYSGIG